MEHNKSISLSNYYKSVPDQSKNEWGKIALFCMFKRENKES